MAKCPKCGGEITKLYFYEEHLRSFKFSVDKGGCPYYDEVSKASIEETEYICGDCYEVVATNEDEASQLLRSKRKNETQKLV